MDFSLNLLIIIADQLMLFIINMLVARQAGEELFGDFTVATNALFLVATFITFGIDSIIAYYVPKFYVKKKYEEIVGLTSSLRIFLQPIYKTLAIGGILLSIAIMALSVILADVDMFEISHPFFLFAWGAVVLSVYTIYIQFFRAVNHMRTAIVLSLLQTFSYFILSLFTYFYLYRVMFHDNPHYFPHVMLIGFIISYVIIVLVSLFLERKSDLQQMYKDTVPSEVNFYKWQDKIYGYTLQNLNKYNFTAIPLFVIEWLGPDEQSVGLFSAVVSIISLAYIAIGPIGILISPDISAAYAQSREVLRKTMVKYLSILTLIALVIIVVIALFAEQILLLYQSNFILALPYTHLCLINILTYAISMPLSRMIQFSKNGSQTGARLTVSLLFSQFLACLILIPWLGLQGAITCYVGINIVYNLAMIVMAIYIYRNEPFENEDL
ncbi:hypothetical protein BN59_00244 [Legionella massiliensis]|uniref:Polysaccharide biosynthesis protein n=1 Tax=Legionella massiliensis TaxID=1034943 RepID=A0A078KNR7_9GAMM|nr:hypothetical protein [Legionella massiliensis]CDZ75980.1 hypothetical protein BN59_00244 [Legionella massiliensis]CEE11718.1 hypothetical protein BN1094_00244 [Legionella massiliensis]